MTSAVGAGREGGSQKADKRNEVDRARRVLTSSRFDMPCDKETKYNVLMYGPWGFQKCIWEPNFTKAKFHSKNVLS